jgi:hypothetical protein
MWIFSTPAGIWNPNDLFSALPSPHIPIDHTAAKEQPAQYLYPCRHQNAFVKKLFVHTVIDFNPCKLRCVHE